MSLEPPELPSMSQQAVVELHAYYQQLVTYHAQALEEAKRMLSHTEVLMQASHGWHWAPPSNQQVFFAPPEPATAITPSSITAKLIEPYQDMSLEEAIVELLDSNPEEVLHVDYITRMLYGEEETHYRLTQHVEAVCYQGAEQGLWYEYPDSPNCFNSNQASFLSEKKAKLAAQPTPFPEATLKPTYRNQTTIKDMALAVLKAKRKSMDAREVANELFETFPAQESRRIRRTLSKAMQSACTQGILERTEKGKYMYKSKQKRN